MKKLHLIDHIQTAVAVINKDMIIVEANNAFQQRHHIKNTNIIGSKCFSSAYKFNESCCNKEASSCPVRESFRTKNASSTTHHFWIDDHAIVEEIITTPIIEKNGDVNYVIEEFRDVTQLLGLKNGIISTCSYCRKIHDEDEQWISFEVYIEKHTGANFSHGICEECSDALLSEFQHQHSDSD